MNLLDVVTPLPATGLFTYAWLLIAIPALSAAVLLIGRAGRRPRGATCLAPWRR